MFGLNSLGAEWKSDFEIGRYELAYTEFYQPLDEMQRYYIRPSIRYEGVTDIIPLDPIGNQEITSTRAGGSFAFGAHITTDYEFEIGISKYQDYLSVPVVGIANDYDAVPIYALINIDNLDNVNFPKQGVKSELKWTKEMSEFGSDYGYEQVYFDLEVPFTFYSNNITMFVKAGYTYDDDDALRLAGTFALGGLFNLSGYAPYYFNGDNMALGVLKYTYELKDGGFFGTLNAPLYAGFSLESGNAWEDKGDVDFESLHHSATIYVAADTLLGPLYLAYGSAFDGEHSAYLYLGEKF